MKIALISTYTPFICGLASYTKYLATALSRFEGVNVVVISEGGSAVDGEAFRVYNSYCRSPTFKQDILQSVDKEAPDLVHLQHAPDLFPNPKEIIELFQEIAERAIKLIVTVHTADTGKNLFMDWREFYKTILQYGDIIVHNAMSLESLKYYSLPLNRVHVIAHGTELFDLPAREDARLKLGFKNDAFIFLMLGFIHGLKNHHTAIIAFNRLKKKPNVKLLIAGTARGGTWYNKFYIQICRLLCLFNKNVIFHTHFIEKKNMADYLAAADVLLLPYWQKYPSSSGIFHIGIGSSIGVMCSDSVKFSEVKEHLGEWDKKVFIPMLSVSKWARAMSEVAENQGVNDKIKEQLYDYAQKTSWDNVAREHVYLYQSAIKADPGLNKSSNTPLLHSFLASSSESIECVGLPATKSYP